MESNVGRVADVPNHDNAAGLEGWEDYNGAENSQAIFERTRFDCLSGGIMEVCDTTRLRVVSGQKIGREHPSKQIMCMFGLTLSNCPVVSKDLLWINGCIQVSCQYIFPNMFVSFCCHDETCDNNPSVSCQLEGVDMQRQSKSQMKTSPGIIIEVILEIGGHVDSTAATSFSSHRVDDEGFVHIRVHLLVSNCAAFDGLNGHFVDIGSKPCSMITSQNKVFDVAEISALFFSVDNTGSHASLYKQPFVCSYGDAVAYIQGLLSRMAVDSCERHLVPYRMIPPSWNSISSQILHNGSIPLSWIPQSTGTKNGSWKWQAPLLPSNIVLVCHDMQGGYIDDANLRLNEAMQPLWFTQMPFIDVFCYFSHHNISIPPPGWTDFCHLNGVHCFGTLITEWDQGKELWKGLFHSDDGGKFLRSNLVFLSQQLGIDGWLLNVENHVDPNSGDLDSLKAWVKSFRDDLRECLPHSRVIWYDSISSRSGKLEWQNTLNSENMDWFTMSDFFFLNYCWDENQLCEDLNTFICQSRNDGAASRSRVLTSVDVFGRGTFGGGKTQSFVAAKVARRLGTSIAVFAPGWTFESCESLDESNQLASELWWGIQRFHCDNSLCADGDWMVTASGGQGWSINSRNGEAISSHDWCSRSQTVCGASILKQLSSSNCSFRTSEADLILVEFIVSLIGTPPDCSDPYEVTVQLKLKEDNLVKCKRVVGEADVAPVDVKFLFAVTCHQLSESSFVITQSGKDKEGWAGHFGVAFLSVSCSVFGCKSEPRGILDCWKAQSDCFSNIIESAVCSTSSSPEDLQDPSPGNFFCRMKFLGTSQSAGVPAVRLLHCRNGACVQNFLCVKKQQKTDSNIASLSNVRIIGGFFAHHVANKQGAIELHVDYDFASRAGEASPRILVPILQSNVLLRQLRSCASLEAIQVSSAEETDFFVYVSCKILPRANLTHSVWDSVVGLVACYHDHVSQEQPSIQMESWESSTLDQGFDLRCRIQVGCSIGACFRNARFPFDCISIQLQSNQSPYLHTADEALGNLQSGLVVSNVDVAFATSE